MAANGLRGSLLCGAATTASVFLWAGGAAMAAQEARSPSDLSQLSIEELSNIEVTSVSKRPEKLLSAPSAIQVITNDDIRRSGVSDIPSALRLAGNLDVAQKNSHEWVISARGFSSDVGNKLLVLSDGRTLYTPLFSGVFWDRQGYLLEDVERIEAISGPGGALWGANAVNGVINITTKSSKDTQGLYAEAGGGTNPHGTAGMRYGGTLSPDVTYRVYGKYADQSGESFPSGAHAGDSWTSAQGGFRVDTDRSARDNFTLQGDLYENDEGIITGGGSSVTGANVLGRWSRTNSDTSDMSLQVYYDRTHLRLPTPPVIFAPRGILKDTLDTVDADFQYRFLLGSHRLIWGLGYRYTHDVVDNSPGLAFFPAVLNQDLFSGFVQDEISLRDDLTLTVGTKLEHNDYTGTEVEPSIRAQWSFTNQQTIWAAVSRAVRAPSRIDREISEPSPGYSIVVLKGGQNFKSESVLAYELGYRAQFNAKIAASVSAFYNDYSNLRSTSISPLDPVFHLPFPFFFENNLEGETYGFELSADAQIVDWWMLRGSYRLLEEDIRVKPGKTDFNKALNETADPKHQFSVRSSMTLPHDVEFDTTLRWVGRRTINNAGVPAAVPSYAEMDVRLGLTLLHALEFSIAGRNLLHDRHPEYSIPSPTRVELGRSVYGKIAWRM